jgi:hypothetical protein
LLALVGAEAMSSANAILFFWLLRQLLVASSVTRGMSPMEEDTRMKVPIFGASGGTGRDLVNQRRLQGLALTAMVRSLSRFTRPWLKMLPGA